MQIAGAIVLPYTVAKSPRSGCGIINFGSDTVAQSAKYLVIGSLEAYSGKSAAMIGVTDQLRQKGLDIGYGKPISGDSSNADTQDEDVSFLAQTLNLPNDRILPTILQLDGGRAILKRIRGLDTHDYLAKLTQVAAQQSGDLVILEGAGTLEDGRLFGLSLMEMADALDASILLVARYHSLQVLDGLLAAKLRLGDRLLGVILNDVGINQIATIETEVKPFLESQGIQVFGTLPSSTLLRSVTVAELAQQLKAEVLCRNDRLDLLVESLVIGAMNVSSALRYFRKRHNKAVVTGGDREDLQLAALETSTQCLILTGHLAPSDRILRRAEEMEVPILSVDLDTLTTVEIVEQSFNQVRLHEPVKVHCVREMYEAHLNCDQLLAALALQPTS